MQHLCFFVKTYIRENTWNVHFINYQRSINSSFTHEYDEFDKIMEVFLPIADSNDSCEYKPGETFDCGPLYAYINTGVSITVGEDACFVNDEFSYCE